MRGLNERVEMAERFASDAQATVEKAKQDIEEATETIAEEAVDEAVDKMTMDEAIGAVNVADALEQEGAGEPGNEPDNEPENRKRKFIKI